MAVLKNKRSLLFLHKIKKPNEQNKRIKKKQFKIIIYYISVTCDHMIRTIFSQAFYRAHSLDHINRDMIYITTVFVIYTQPMK